MNNQNAALERIAMWLFFWLMGFTVNADPTPMHSVWVKNSKGELIQDPQTSGLVYWRGQLLTIADGSAAVPMRMQLLPIDVQSLIMSSDTIPMVQSPAIKNGCFSDYLNYGPDLEALVVDPDDDNVFIVVTEDAYKFRLQGDCLQRYGVTGSTPYPTTLLRVELTAPDRALITHVKPVRFPAEYRIGNSPNDGVEGLAFGAGRTLYLALEKDAAKQARIFELEIDEQFWQSSDMAVVTDSQLKLPVFTDNIPHPINALTYYPVDQQRGLLFAAARNDNSVWILDTAKQRETVVVEMTFLAESLVPECPQWQVMNNFSIEGITIVKDSLFLINDPWKVSYKKNALCQEMLPAYTTLSPLITSIKLQSAWLN